MSNKEYFVKERLRALNNYSSSKHKGFSDRNDFADWFVLQLKEHGCKCYYCETSIHDITKLIDKKLLKQRRTGYGWRGPVLEVDKNDDSYSKAKCVLSCYYCNNDKSYIISKENYKKYFGPARNFYFKQLLKHVEA